MYGNPNTTSGGMALRYYACHRLELRRQSTQIKEGENIIGSQVRIHCIKNKIAPPYRETTLDLIYGQGFDMFSDIIKVGVSSGIIDKSGSWYSYGDTKLGQGEHNASKTLQNNPQILQEVRNKILGIVDVSVRNDDNSGISGDGE